MFFSLTCFSQEKPQVEIIEASRTRSCGFISGIYDNFVQGTPIEKNVIIVSYKGKNESKANIAERRLHNAKIYFTEYYKKTRFSRPENTIITTLGVGESREGKLDFYVDGNLRLTLLFLDNIDFHLSPCYLDLKDYCEDEMKKLFYPCYKPENSPK